MAVSLDTLLGGSIRNMGAVHPKTKEYALELVKRAHKIGIQVIITSGLRSMEEQARLYGQGRGSYVYKGKQYGNPSKNVVTKAKPGQSIHNYGYAVDFALMLDNGAVVWDMNRDANGIKGSDWREVAALAKQMGFYWGGDWRDFPDYPHIDLGNLSWQQLQAGKRPTIKPLQNPTPTGPRDYYMNGDAGTDIKKYQEQLTYIGLPVTIDGIYGDQMESTVKLFQSRKQLDPDGILGKGTMKKLQEVYDERKAGEVAKPATSTPIETEEAITLAEILKLSTNEGKNAQLRVLKRFEKKEPALSTQWREKVEKGEFTYDDFAEVFFVAVDRGYITGLVNTDALQEKVEALEKALAEK